MTSLWRTKKALVGTVLALIATVVCVNLGLWQLRRLDQRRSENGTVAQRSSAAPETPEELAAVATVGGAGDVTFRRATATGVYVVAEEILLTGRTSNGSPGHHVLTPLFTADGRALLVDRGWVPYALNRPPVAEAAPPSGTVRVDGLVFANQPKTRFGPSIPQVRDLAVVGRVDLPRLQQQVSRPLYPFWVQLSGQQPATASALPVVAPPPELNEGTHLSYAVQWFGFAAIIGAGWPLLLRRAEREASAGGDAGPVRRRPTRAGSGSR